MPSIEPDDGSGEVDRGQEVDGPLVVAGRDGPVLLELGEEVLDEVTRLVQSLVVRARVLAAGLGRDQRFFARLLQRGEDPSFGIERRTWSETPGT